MWEKLSTYSDFVGITVNNKKFLRGKVCMQQYLFEYFGSEDHSNFLNEVEIIFTETANPKDPNRRSQWRCSMLKAVYKNFAIFTGDSNIYIFL